MAQTIRRRSEVVKGHRTRSTSPHPEFQGLHTTQKGAREALPAQTSPFKSRIFPSKPAFVAVTSASGNVRLMARRTNRHRILSLWIIFVSPRALLFLGNPMPSSCYIGRKL